MGSSSASSSASSSSSSGLEAGMDSSGDMGLELERDLETGEYPKEVEERSGMDLLFREFPPRPLTEEMADMETVPDKGTW